MKNKKMENIVQVVMKEHISIIVDVQMNVIRMKLLLMMNVKYGKRILLNF